MRRVRIGIEGFNVQRPLIALSPGGISERKDGKREDQTSTMPSTCCHHLFFTMTTTHELSLKTSQFLLHKFVFRGGLAIGFTRQQKF